MREPGSPERRAPRETDCGRIGSAELFRSRRRRRRHRRSGHTMTELPGVREGGMPGRNGQRTPGTARGSPRRSRTAKALRISRHAVKSQCARGWGGWGRLSDDGARQHNLHPSEDPWGGGLPHLHGGARSNGRPDTAREYRNVTKCAKGGHKPTIASVCREQAFLPFRAGLTSCRKRGPMHEYTVAELAVPTVPTLKAREHHWADTSA